MSKRFTDTDKWSDPWFRRLAAESKILFLFLADNVDTAGFWKVDFELASLFCGFQVGAEPHLERFNADKQRVKDHVSYWELVDFISFQYGALKSDCRPHKSVIDLLRKHRRIGYRYPIDTLSIPYGYPSNRVSVDCVEKEKETEREKEKEKEKVLKEKEKEKKREIKKEKEKSHFLFNKSNKCKTDIDKIENDRCKINRDIYKEECMEKKDTVQKFEKISSQCINKTGRSKAKKKFLRPSIEELTAHFTVKGYPTEALRFFNYFESVGWVVGRSLKPMKSWRGAVATWIGNIGERAKTFRRSEDKKPCGLMESERIKKMEKEAVPPPAQFIELRDSLVGKKTV